MPSPRPPAFEYWRVGVCGSSNSMPTPVAEMCEAIGEALARAPNVKVVHHGLKLRDRTRPDRTAADWHFVEGARRVLGPDIETRIETLLYDDDGGGVRRSSDPTQVDPTADEAAMFIAGDTRKIRARTFQARRFTFVSTLDAIIGVRGGYGTQQQLTLAAAIDIPVLPVPCCGGRSTAFWNENEADLADRLGLDQETRDRWRSEPVTGDEIAARADEMVARLVAQLPKRAFVIMPYAATFDTLFDLVIAPAVAASGDEIRRLDRLQTPGAITDQITDGIRTSDYCIVVLDGFRPNVLYELGYAQALGKPVILILRDGDDQEPPDVPFDISTLQRIGYVRPDAQTLANLSNAVAQVVPRRWAQRRR